MSETKKDALETAAAAGLAMASATGIGAAAVPGLVGLAWLRLQERRVEKWWKLVINRATEPETLSAKIEAGLVEDDEAVIAGVVGGARASSSAIELAAVAVIAELSRRYFECDLPRWFYRGALEVLERVDALELRALRQLLVEIQDIRSDSVTILGDIEGQRNWQAFQTSVPDPSRALTPFLTPARLFGYLKRAGLGFDSGGYDIDGSSKVLVIDREPADWLTEALVAVVS